MLEINKNYKAKLLGLETPEERNMRTLKIAIPEEKTIFKGVSVFLDNAKNASTTLTIWLTNIIRQNKLKIELPTPGNIEYLQEIENKYKGKDPHKVASSLMLNILEELAEKQIEFEVTYTRNFDEKRRKYYTNLVPYVIETDDNVETELIKY